MRMHVLKTHFHGPNPTVPFHAVCGLYGHPNANKYGFNANAGSGFRRNRVGAPGFGFVGYRRGSAACAEITSRPRRASGHLRKWHTDS